MKIKPGYSSLNFIVAFLFSFNLIGSPYQDYKENTQIELISVTDYAICCSMVLIDIRDTTNISKIGVSYSTDSTNITKWFIEFTLQDFRKPGVKLFWERFSQLTEDVQYGKLRTMIDRPTQLVKYPSDGQWSTDCPNGCNTITKEQGIYFQYFKQFKPIMTEGKGQLKVQLFMDANLYFIKGYVIDSENNKYYTEQKRFLKHDPSNGLFSLESIMMALAFAFISTKAFLFLLIPIAMFIYFIFFKRFKVIRSLKHVSIYILLCMPLVLISGFLNFVAGFGGGGSSPPYLFISTGVLAILYLIILNWWARRKARGYSG